MRDYERLRERDLRDMEDMAYKNRNPLHHSTGIPLCEHPRDCKLCTNAARLAIQHYRPILERRVVEHIMSEYDVRCEFPHGGD